MHIQIYIYRYIYTKRLIGRQCCLSTGPCHVCVFCSPCTCLMYLMLCGNALCCSIKRLIGRQFSDKTVQHDKKLLPYSIVSKEVSLCLSVLLFCVFCVEFMFSPSVCIFSFKPGCIWCLLCGSSYQFSVFGPQFCQQSRRVSPMCVCECQPPAVSLSSSPQRHSSCPTSLPLPLSR